MNKTCYVANNPFGNKFALKKLPRCHKNTNLKYTPITLNNMTLNTTHSGRVIHGSLIVRPLVMTAV